MCAAGRRRQITLVVAVVVVDIVSDKWNCMFSDLLTIRNEGDGGKGME